MLFGNEDCPDFVRVYIPDFNMPAGVKAVRYEYPPDSDGSAMVPVTFDTQGKTIFPRG